MGKIRAWLNKVVKIGHTKTERWRHALVITVVWPLALFSFIGLVPLLALGMLIDRYLDWQFATFDQITKNRLTWHGQERHELERP